MKHYLLVIGIIIICIIQFVFISTPSLYLLTFPKAAHDVKSGAIKDRKTYLENLYDNPPHPAPHPAPPSWTMMEERRWMKTPRKTAAAAVLNGTIYALGGVTRVKNASTATVETFTAAGGGTWVTGTPMRTARFSFGAAAVECKLVVAGGLDNNYNVLASAEVFDPASPGTWTSAASMATQRWGHCVTALGTLVYSIGGWDNNNNVLNSVEAYDITANAWAPVANMTTARTAAAAYALNGKLYVIGGLDINSNPLSSVDVFDPTGKGTWTSVANMTTARAYAAASILNEKLYVMGGCKDIDNKGCTILNSVEAYDITANAWAPVANMTTARYNAAASTLNEKLYVMGGQGNNVLNSVEYYDPPPPPAPPSTADKNLDWLWDTAPKSMLDKIPIAENLSFVWPPPKGSRYRLTAFPYPDTGDSSFWVVRFAKGMSSLLDNTAGQVTFPGWQISIYDPSEPNYNSWQNFLTKDLPNSGISCNAIYVEVTHACYAPPTYKYPTCDDGGYWLYGTAGSGVFWKTCGTKIKDGTKPGQYLVCNNKIDAIFKLWNRAQSSSAEGNKKALEALLKIANLNPSKAPEMKAEDYIMARLKGSGGGLNLMQALRKIIKASHEGKQIPSLTAWRSMELSKAKTSWATWIALSITLVSILLVLGGVCIYTIYLAIKDRKIKKWWASTLIVIGSILGTVLLGYLFTLLEWNIISENMFVGFGYTTLDMALKKSGLDLESFIFATAGLDRNYKNLSKGKYNPIANGFAQTQMFDFDLSYLTSMLDLDSVIMHAQPNKSGSWAVEILDVRNTPAKGKSTLKELIFSLGLCGQPIDSKNKQKMPPLMPPLMQGPLKLTPEIYFGYQPSASCNCNDTNVAKQYADGKGTLKKCVYCKGSLSETVC